MPKTLYVISKRTECGNLKPEIYTYKDEAKKALNQLHVNYMYAGTVDYDSKYDNGFKLVYTDDTFIECELFKLESTKPKYIIKKVLRNEDTIIDYGDGNPVDNKYFDTKEDAENYRDSILHRLGSDNEDGTYFDFIIEY